MPLICNHGSNTNAEFEEVINVSRFFVGDDPNCGD